MIDLKQSVQYVKGVGPNRVKVLNSIGIRTLDDLITYFPRTYEDRSKPKLISNLPWSPLPSGCAWYAHGCECHRSAHNRCNPE